MTPRPTLSAGRICHPHRSVLLLIILMVMQSAVALAQCNASPTAVNDSAQTPDNRTLWLDPLANDMAPNGDALALSIVSEDCPGTVDVAPNGYLVYTPTAIAPETEQTCDINYRITDEADATATAVVTITVVTIPPTIFIDGFETGDTSAWTSVE